MTAFQVNEVNSVPIFLRAKWLDRYILDHSEAVTLLIFSDLIISLIDNALNVK